MHKEIEDIFAEFLEGMPEIVINEQSKEKDIVRENFKNDHDYIKESFAQYLMQKVL